jgi:hypothetical protein
LYNELGIKLARAETDAVEQSYAQGRYPGQLKTVQDVIKEFEADPALKGFLPNTQIIAAANKAALEQNFKGADDALQDLEDRLRTQLAKAKARKAGLDDAAAKLAEEKEKKRVADKRIADEAADQLAREQAMAPASLDAIGRDDNFGLWYSRVKILLDAGIVTVSCPGGAQPYNSMNYEAIVQVTAPGFATYFVVHYHLGAKAATMKDPYASGVHAKPDSFIDRRIYLNPDNWVHKFAPTLSSLKR